MRPATDLKAAANALVERTRRAQGLPPTVDDAEALRRIAELAHRGDRRLRDQREAS